MGVIKDAFRERETYGSDLLIIGGGKLCENTNNSSHTPHPRGCLTASLPRTALNVGMYVAPDIEADVTVAHTFVKKVRAVRTEPFKVIHFENIDNDVVTSVGALASAHALLAEGGLLIIECGPLGRNIRGTLEQRPRLAIQHIQQILRALGIDIIKAKPDITIVARKRTVPAVRISKLTILK